MATPKASTSSADTQITKRLHVSGLTANITKDDLSKRLSTFGTVTALDKFGEKDAVGQTKKFGYVTIETTQGKLARCMNLLSGTTWKGAKLRIGEAKPDWRERLQKDTDPEPRKKKPKRYGGLMAEDMSLVTPANASSRAGWKVTPLGRVLHPVKMRPSHPLPPTKDALEMQRKEEEAAKKGKAAGKKRKRAKEPDTRARRRTIDVTKWGSTHLKGAFLDAVVADGELSEKLRDQLVVGEDVEMGSEEEETETDDNEQATPVEEEDNDQVADEEADSSLEEEPPTQTKPPSGVTSPHLLSPPSSTLPAIPISPPAAPPVLSTVADDDTDITAEKSRSLNLLASLFGAIDDGDDDWDGHESLDSDIDEEAVKKSRQDRPASGGGVDREDEFEIVPRDSGKIDKKKKVIFEGQNDEEDADEDAEEEDAEDGVMANIESPKQQPEPVPTTTVSAAAPAPAPPRQATNLKDLFAPRDDEAGFSLIGHLDLDLELDDEIPFAIDEVTTHADGGIPSAESYPPVSVQPSAPSTARKTASGHSGFFLDPKKPLFFPHPPSASGQSITKARPKDILEHFVELGWGWRQPLPSSTNPNAEKEKERLFYRTATEEEIRKRWEDKKLDLTREWKRRHKEASKFSSRRRGGDGGDGETI